MKNGNIKNILIGAFVLLAFSIIVCMLIFLHPRVGDNGKTLKVRFADIDKVTVGTRVTYAGRPVGEVVSIEEIPEARTSRINSNGDVYVYELVLKVDSSVDVYNTDEISLRTSGLLGERNIEINPRPLEKGEKLILVDNEILYAASTSNIEEVLKRLGLLSDTFKVVLEDFDHLMDRIKKEKVVENASKAIKNVADITEALNEPKLIKETIVNIHTLSESLNLSWKKVDESLGNIAQLSARANGEWSQSFSEILERANKATTHLEETFVRTREIVQSTSEGKGSLGQLLLKDDLYLRLKSLIHKGSTIMDDIGHYGILFQTDKRWQRLQARRMRLMEKFSTPQEFACFFNHELDEITSSVSRVAILIDDSQGCANSLLFNPEFTTRFSDLLRQVGTMEDTLQFYNEQIIGQE